MPKVPRVPRLGALSEYRNALAPQLGFFSTLDELIREAPFERGSAEQWSGYLQPGRMLKRDEAQFPLKQEELDYALEGLEGFKGSSLDKGSLLTYLRQTRPEFNLDVSRSPRGGEQDLMGQLRGRGDLRARLVEERYGPTRYGGSRLSHESPESTYQESVTRYPRMENAAGVVSQHFSPDTLSWSRTSSHQLPSGEKMRLVEEIQSDLHEAAAERAGDPARFLTPEEEIELDDLREERSSEMQRGILSEDVERIRELDQRRADIYAEGKKRIPRRGYSPQEADERTGETGPGVPDAPFKNPDEYATLELRKQLLNAVNNNEDYLALTTGEDQIQRYSLDDPDTRDRSEGMEYIYDTIYPSVLRRLANRYGTEVVNVEAPLGTASDVRPEIMRDFEWETTDDAVGHLGSMLSEPSGLESVTPQTQLEDMRKLTKDFLSQLKISPRVSEEEIGNLGSAFDEILDRRLERSYKTDYQLDGDITPKELSVLKSFGELLDKALQVEGEKSNKTFPALRLTPEVRERIKRVGVPLWSIVGGSVLFDDEEPEAMPQEFAKGGSVKPGKSGMTGLQYLRAAADSLANQVPFVSPETRQGIAEDITRPLGGLASQWMGPDPETGESAFARLPSRYSASWPYTQREYPVDDSVVPGLVTETVGLPADFMDLYGLATDQEMDAPDWARRAQESTAQLRGGMMEELQLDEPSGLKEHLLESLGIMGGQLPIGSLPAVGRSLPRVARGALAPLSAAAEWFAPTIVPRASNYAMGTAFGGALGTGVEHLIGSQVEGFKEEVNAAVESGELSLEDAEIILNSLEDELGTIESPETEETYVTGGKFAKGGNVNTPIRNLQRMVEMLEKKKPDYKNMSDKQLEEHRAWLESLRNLPRPVEKAKGGPINLIKARLQRLESRLSKQGADEDELDALRQTVDEIERLNDRWDVSDIPPEEEAEGKNIRRRSGPPSPLSEGQIAEVVQRRNTGESLTQISRDIGIPYTNLHKLLRRRGVAGEPRSYTRFTPDQVREIYTRRLAGEKVTAIARDLGTSQPAVTQILQGKYWKNIRAEFIDPLGEIGAPNIPEDGFAKGGPIKPRGTLTALRQRLADLIAPSAAVEGTGQEMVPVEPTTPPRWHDDPATGEPLDPEITLDQISARLREEPQGTEAKPFGTVSRRDVLRGMGQMTSAALSPIQLDPLSMIGKELESLGTAVEAAPVAAAARSFTPPQLANALQIIWDNVLEGSEDSVEILADLAQETSESPQLSTLAPHLKRAAELERRVAYDELDSEAPEYQQGWTELRAQAENEINRIADERGLAVLGERKLDLDSIHTTFAHFDPENPNEFFETMRNSSYDRPSAILEYLDQAKKSDLLKEIDIDKISMYPEPDETEMKLLEQIFGGEDKIPESLLSGIWDT